MIKKLLSNAMLSLVMDERAKEKLRTIRGGPKLVDDGDGMTEPPGRPAPGPDRRELIARAMAIHQSKIYILDDLTLDEKRRLRELAARTLLAASRGGGDE